MKYKTSQVQALDEQEIVLSLMARNYANKKFIIYVKFKYNWNPVFLLFFNTEFSHVAEAGLRFLTEATLLPLG